ncbi:polysaccharide biosynthesis/export family protein [Pelomicrobium methylotrophicum]|uniref:Polysaccharide export protein n=1 Tax=Pelomicrobium methylotrophicum TaxID=2602750 RepID=A0A5C7ESY2_9PROT|nr:polysaccharide biosynthesis/export family protein [Pelomicrobium methylotrophicum]TXF10970.1 polysaccharide export protein [Pelomicrobium methylotrophicum]
MNSHVLRVVACRCIGCAFITLTLSGCATFPDWLASSGPSRQQVIEVPQQESSAIRLVEINEAVARRLLDSDKQQRFSEFLSVTGAPGYVVGPGDVVEVSIWEAPPATLFGAAVADPRVGMTTARASILPEQMVAVDGTITVPFAGVVQAGGRTPRQIEADIVKQLTGKANQPQVLVRVTRNSTANVTVVGEVGQSVRMPLTAKGERLLDAIAAAGGVKQAVGKVTVQVTRGGKVLSMPLERVIRDPSENILLAPGDVITVLFQPLSFTVLGATVKNEEIPFEATGITLAQALGRAGGLHGERSDAGGVFIFRFEDPVVLDERLRQGPTTPDGRIPVVYRLDMKDPASFLLAQNFPVYNKDVIYVANAPSAELQKFLNILTSSIFSVSSLINLSK